MYAGLQSLKSKFNLTITVSDNQFVVADAANLIRQYASQGYDLVIAHGSQYGSTLQQLAPQFPKVAFAWGTAGSTFNQPNIFAYQINANEGGYAEGYMAALLSKSHVLGEIGPINVGDAQLYVDGFKAGVLAADPKANVHVTFTGSFSDVGLMANAAKAFIADGADVLTGSPRSVVGAIGVAKAQNVAWFGNAVGSDRRWPRARSWPPRSTTGPGSSSQMLTAIDNGNLGGATYTATLGNGGEKIQFNSGYSLPDSVKTAGQKVIDQITSGSLTVARSRFRWPAPPGKASRCSRCAASPSASRGCSPTTTSTSTCGLVRSTRCSGRTAPGRAPSCGSSTACTALTRARSASTAYRSPSRHRPPPSTTGSG